MKNLNIFEVHGKTRVLGGGHEKGGTWIVREGLARGRGGG